MPRRAWNGRCSLARLLKGRRTPLRGSRRARSRALGRATQLRRVRESASRSRSRKPLDQRPFTAPKFVLANECPNCASSKANLLVQRRIWRERVEGPHDLPQREIVALEVGTHQVGKSIDRRKVAVRTTHLLRMHELARSCRTWPRVVCLRWRREDGCRRRSRVAPAWSPSDQSESDSRCWSRWRGSTLLDADRLGAATSRCELLADPIREG